MLATSLVAAVPAGAAPTVASTPPRTPRPRPRRRAPSRRSTRPTPRPSRPASRSTLLKKTSQQRRIVTSRVKAQAAFTKARSKASTAFKAEELLGGGPRNDKITKAERASLKSLRNAWSRR